MSETVTLAAEPRTGSGSHAAAKLRKLGRVPAIIYGHKEPVVAISISAEDLRRAIMVQHARVLDLTVSGKTEKVLIRELQWDHLGDIMLHADFTRISKDEKVKVTVPVKLKNTPKNTGGGVLEQPFHTLHIECLAVAIPEEITIDITTLTLGKPIHVRELILPSGVIVQEPADTIVVQLKLPGAQGEDAVVLGGETGAGPEIIKKEKKAADDEE